MLVSHEVPLSLLNKSKAFNDYDYCLLHLTYEYPEYKQYYQDAVKEGRKVLLDNSLFELGDSLTLAQVAQGVETLHPTWVVVPDCLNDKEITIQRFKEWGKEYQDLDVLTIGVVQGKTFSELIDCYLFISEHADKIAIPFGSTVFYHFNLPKVSTQLLKGTLGRQSFIEYLVKENLWNYTKPHHLLGCNLAIEFANPRYKDLNIETIDTSNPVVAALCHLQYHEFGLLQKPSIKLCDLITYQVTEEDESRIQENIQKFKKLGS